jgi:hypothetical protein
MNHRKTITSYFIFVLIAMTWYRGMAYTRPSISSLSEYAGKSLNVIGGYVTVCKEPWGLATMFDAYFGFMTFWLYVAWRENNNLVRFASSNRPYA